MLQKLAKVFYNQIVVTSLNVDRENYWANRFVPADYSTEHSCELIISDYLVENKVSFHKNLII